jgi:hypothetical protein
VTCSPRAELPAALSPAQVSDRVVGARPAPSRRPRRRRSARARLTRRRGSPRPGVRCRSRPGLLAPQLRPPWHPGALEPAVPPRAPQTDRRLYAGRPRAGRDSALAHARACVIAAPRRGLTPCKGPRGVGPAGGSRWARRGPCGAASRHASESRTPPAGRGPGMAAVPVRTLRSDPGGGPGRVDSDANPPPNAW